MARTIAPIKLPGVLWREEGRYSCIGPRSILGVTLRHHWSAWTGDWHHGACEDCGWWGREFRSPQAARNSMVRHAASCKPKPRYGR